MSNLSKNFSFSYNKIFITNKDKNCRRRLKWASKKEKITTKINSLKQHCEWRFKIVVKDMLQQ